ncbi:MgtC/SapB family protein [Hydrogenobacter hydrogenophilus]|uniref:Putative Mg2+ transporter-C (MgtC) family protein n=1 Tax=Hydrogenobacter hydrogenophilus TaxID=35835 RepID=A0A285NRX0_9AQUI|nr:MgtC/SapB family protein [Hydrogenobacter hydrogenophilus]SNZ12270.1 putative Mg2+ transporter-C (MgtC) family protein [Hydrogenobacter hydrogenophilus]
MSLTEHLPFPVWEGFLRITLAFLSGALIGLEREKRRQPAGFRTHSVLALGSALMSVLSLYTAYAYGQGVSADPSRIASQVITGIGFLGAGAIIRLGVSIKGLTTAASLWTTAGIGLSIGMGMYTMSLFALLLLLLTLSAMSRIEKEFIRMGTRYIIELTVEGVEDPVNYLRDFLRDFEVRRVLKLKEGFEITLQSELNEREKDTLMERFIKDKFVKSVEIL